MKNRYIVLIVIVAVLLIIRIILPFIIKNQINKHITELEGYSGGVNRVSLQLYKGGIQIHDFTLFREVSVDPSNPFLKLGYGDVSIFWGELIKGRVVVNVILNQLHVSFTKLDDNLAKDMNIVPVDALLKELIPFKINFFKITNGKIGYKDITTTPEIDIYLSDFSAEVTNIQNIERSNDTLPATLHIESSALNSGHIALDASLNLMNDIPDFEYTLEIENINLIHFDPFFEAYLKFNLSEGFFNLYSESAAHKGFIIGYVKPMIENLEIVPIDDNASTIQKFYAAIMDGIGNLLESGETDHIGTRVEFEGRIDNPDAGVWPAVWLLIRNAFFDSVSSDVDNTIDFDNLT